MKTFQYTKYFECNLANAKCKFSAIRLYDMFIVDDNAESVSHDISVLWICHISLLNKQLNVKLIDIGIICCLEGS